MAYSPNEHDLVMRERRADALRNAENWRLLKSIRPRKNRSSWFTRLQGREPRMIYLPREEDAPRPSHASRPSISSSQT